MQDEGKQVMGMFYLPKGDRANDLVECVIGDLQIFLGPYDIRSGDHPKEYLLLAAINILKEALAKYRTECGITPNTNAPSPSNPKVDIELALEHAKGHEIEDCSMILYFLQQHQDQINEFLGRIDCAVQSQLGVSAALRYTWRRQWELPNWTTLINTAWKYYENEDRESLFCGLTKYVDKQ